LGGQRHRSLEARGCPVHGSIRRRSGSGNLFSMNLYGYDRGEAGDELETPRELSEVSVVAHRAVLRGSGQHRGERPEY